MTDITQDVLARQRSDNYDGPLVSVEDLEVSFRTLGGAVQALRGVSFEIWPGETVAIVGESGSGKSTTATALINLLPSNGSIGAGSIKIDGREMVGLSQDQMASVRGKIVGYVPQDPMSNLNPVWSVGFQVEEAVRANGLAHTRKEIKARAMEVLEEAGLGDAARRMKQFPHQFSGGMRQRVLIGIGLAANPKFLIADEPTSALDVTVQKTILDHLDKLTRENHTAVLFITHDLGLAAERASKLIVMHRGKIVEAGPSVELLQNPQHPYTKSLIAAAPSLASRRIRGSASESQDEGSATRHGAPQRPITTSRRRGTPRCRRPAGHRGHQPDQGVLDSQGGLPHASRSRRSTTSPSRCTRAPRSRWWGSRAPARPPRPR